VEASARKGSSADRAALGARGALWPLPWASPRDLLINVGPCVLEDTEESSERPSPQASCGAVVLGHEP
jgi:hypothetical protein